MAITNIVILIVLLLVASVIGSIIFTKKEQAAALKRQQIANYRIKADEAQDFYDGLQSAGLEKVAYHFLLDRIIVNLKSAYALAPGTPGVKLRLESARSTLESLDSITFTVVMPSAMAELHALVSRLNKLVKYLVILFQKRLIPEHLYQQLMPSVQRTLIKFEAEGHIKMGHQAANEGQPGTAKQSYLYAKEKLINFGVDDSYVQDQLEKVEGLIQILDQETNPVDDETTQIDSQHGNQQSPEGNDIVNDAPSQESAAQQAAAIQKQLNKESGLASGGFETKKKW